MHTTIDNLPDELLAAIFEERNLPNVGLEMWVLLLGLPYYRALRWVHFAL
jgi:hypothetical protein